MEINAEPQMLILLVEDNPTNLTVLKAIIGELDGCTVEAFSTAAEAHARALQVEFDLVVADHMMPGMTGTELIGALRSLPVYADVPSVVVSADRDRGTRHGAILAGATDFLSKPVDPTELKAKVRNLLTFRQSKRAVEQRAATLSQVAQAATNDVASREEEIIWRLARALEYRDGGTGDHVSRVADVCRLIAEGLGCDQEFIRLIYLAAPLHDVGKVGVPDSILSKPGRLTDAEVAIMRQHVSIGAKILDNGSSELVRMAARIAATHHEKWDGTGYPRGLSGSEIPLEGRITAVADVFDALCSDRPYKKAWSMQAAYEEISRCAGGHFDPACVAAFQSKWRDISSILVASEATAA